MELPHVNARAANAFAVTVVIGVLVMAGRFPGVCARKSSDDDRILREGGATAQYARAPLAPLSHPSVAFTPLGANIAARDYFAVRCRAASTSKYFHGCSQ